MRDKSRAYATYWRTSLADADLGKGAFRKNDIAGFLDACREELQSGRLRVALVTELFAGAAKEVETVNIAIRPLVYRCRLEHGKLRRTGAPDIVTPVVTHAYVDRSGRIYPTANTFIPRDLLEPLDRGSFSIGEVSDLDTWLQGHRMPDFDLQSIDEQALETWHFERWQRYREYYREMFESVCKGWSDETGDFIEDNRWSIVKTDNTSGASKHILSLYDHLRRTNPDAPLFDTYASEEVSPPEPCLPANAGFSLRLGHASETIPLNDAQRDAMTHHVVSGPGEILAINGPPGTGKTTLLLSIVASHWVQAALAKQALVIGDTEQIEPIWSINASIDIGNLRMAGLIRGNVKERYDRVRALGKSSASGSVMAIAQQATRYHYDPALARGMFLYEHWRCYDEIVAYCNALCYRNKLIPKRRSGEGRGIIPAMGYLHINGICTRRGSTSRQNMLEAETIALWIAHHKHELEKHYGKEINDIVGVVTPFGGQVAAITEACHAKGIPIGKKAGEMTVGTVHSLQGAERDVVIFSPTYSIHFDGPFIDRTSSMLNVAVSRAKDSFLVFGDMEIFDPNEGRPRGLLASFLYKEIGNALDFAPLPRRDIAPKDEDLLYLHDAEQHDAFLLEVLGKAAREVHIVSPWLRLQRMEETGVLPAMADAASRGVTVTVYAEQSLNIDRNPSKETEGRRHWLAAAQALEEAGILLVDVTLVHSKILIQDEALLCIGSFNWLSAARSGQHARHETSISYTGRKVGDEVKVILRSLHRRAGKAT